jgi:LTXXQ motif family protein
MKRIATLLAVSVAVLGAGLAHAQAPGGPGPGSDGPRMERRMERMSERFDKRLGKIRTDLKLTPQQEPLFAPIEAHIRKNMAEMRGMRGRMEEMRNAELPARLDMMSERAAKMSANMRELSGLVKPLWATLDDSQKATVKKFLPGRGGMRGEGRERGHHGHDRG